MKKALAFLGMLCSLSVAVAAQETGESLVLRAPPGETRIEIEGATPGATVVVLGVSHRRTGFLPTTTRIERLAEADSTGRAEATVPRPIPGMSVWVAIDLESGELAVVSPPRLALEIEKPGRDLGNTLIFLEDQRQFLHVLVARPESGPQSDSSGALDAGAWGVLVGDGGDYDQDGVVDGRVELSFLDLRSITPDSPPPKRLAPGDVVIGVDSLTLQFYA